jgi:hypothetical protein
MKKSKKVFNRLPYDHFFQVKPPIRSLFMIVSVSSNSAGIFAFLSGASVPTRCFIEFGVKVWPQRWRICTHADLIAGEHRRAERFDKNAYGKAQ